MSAVHRADLLRALAAGLPVDVAARTLGFVRDAQRDGGGSPVDDRFGDVAVGEPSPAFGPADVVWPRPDPIRLWCLTEMTFTDAPAPRPTRPPGEALRSDDLIRAGQSYYALPPPPPLTPWPRLLPILERALAATTPSRAVAPDRLARRMARLEGIDPLPRRTRRGTAARAELWLDRSPRMRPFFGDQDEVAARLRDRVGPGLVVRDVRSDAPARAAGPVVWLGFPRTCACPSPRATAVVPEPVDGRAQRGWRVVAWDDRPPASPEERDAAVERLLTLLSPALIAPLGFVRALRLHLGAAGGDVGVESLLWRHPDVMLVGSAGVRLSPEARERRLKLFAELDEGVRSSVGVCLRRWRSWGAGLPAGVVRAETLLWTALSDDHAAAPGDVDDARAFAARLAESSRTRPDPAVLAFGAALPTAVYAKYPELRRLWSWVWGDRVDVPVPDGYRRADLAAEIDPEPPPDRWWGLRQVGQRLVGHPMPDGAWPSAVEGPGSPVAWLLAVGPTATIDGVQRRLDALDLPVDREQPIRVETDRCVATITPWRREGFDAAGQDRYGLWADAKVRGEGGEARIRMRWIPPGRGVMGSPESELGRFEDEGPRHEVVFTRGFWLGETPVTQAQWYAVTGERPSRFQDGPDAPRRPVEQVDWDACGVFAAVVGARRPTEAQWEFACRAGTTGATWFGELDVEEGESKVLADRAWYKRNSGDTTHPVAAVPANPLGLFDTLGNVWEWCEDEVSFGAPYGAVPVRVDPPAATGGPDRVLRGGSWYSSAGLARAAFRFAFRPGVRYDYLGFRLARGPAPGQAGGRAEPDQGRTESDQGRAQTDPGPRSGPARSARGRGAPRRGEEGDP